VSGGAAVVADSWWRAKTALDLMPIEWEGENGNRTTEEIFAANFETIKKPSTIVLEEGGSYAAARSKAARVVEASYTVPYLEPGSATAMVTPERVDVWTGDQSPDRALLRAAQELVSRLTSYTSTPLSWVAASAAGGGSDQIRQAVVVAKTLNGRPVKLIWTREEDMCLGEKYRPVGIGRFEAALDANGWPVALSYWTNGDRYDAVNTAAGT